MVITWHGFSCFTIEETARGSAVTLVTDPFTPEGKARMPRNISADLLTVSHDHARHNNIKDVGGDPFTITSPGEYEVKDVFVNGVKSQHGGEETKKRGGNTIYYITIGDVHFAHLGDLSDVLATNQMGDMHDIDVLFIPVGGGDVLDAKKAADVVAQFEPRIIIPMHYKSGEYGTDLESVEPFVKVMGLSTPETLSKLKLAKKDLPQDDMQVIILDPQ